jgi:hypothetical protein
VGAEEVDSGEVARDLAHQCLGVDVRLPAFGITTRGALKIGSTPTIAVGPYHEGQPDDVPIPGRVRSGDDKGVSTDEK